MATVRFAVTGGSEILTDDSSAFSNALSSVTGTRFTERSGASDEPNLLMNEDRLVVREEIYGRTREVSLLQEAFMRVRGVQGSDGSFLQRGGSSEVIAIHGPSGTGKTKLVEAALRNYAPDNNGCLVAGKFNQYLMTGESYSALTAAFSDLCDLLVSGHTEPELIQLRKELTTELGSEAQTLTLLIPNLHYLLPQVKCNSFGEVDPSVVADGSQAPIRLKQLCCSFLQTIAKAGKPVALFLDDLQWADEASMELVEALVSNPWSKHVLFVAAFRDDEEETPQAQEAPSDQEAKTRSWDYNSFVQTINEKLEDSGGRRGATVVEVGNLNVNSINDIVAALTNSSHEKTTELSSVVFQKTNGNPYFIKQYLDLLKRNEMLIKTENGYEWDLERIQLETNVSDNVVELVAGKIESLSTRMQEVLRLAAFLGCRFHYTYLEAMLAGPADGGPGSTGSDDQSGSHTTDERSLSSSLAMGRQHRSELSNLLNAAVAEGLLERSSKRIFKFAHDRVQQCLVAMVQEGHERIALHLSIGRTLASQWHERTIVSDASLRGQMLLLMTDHFNLGLSLIKDEEEMIDLVRWNLDASKWSLRQTAFGSSAEYLRKGLLILDQQCNDKWVVQYDLTLKLCSMLGHLEYCNGNYTASDKVCQEVLERAETLQDKVDAYVTMVRCLGSQKGKIKDSITLGLSVLAKLGEPFPKKPRTWYIIGEMMKTRKALRGLSNEDLLSLPPMTDQTKLSVIDLMFLVMFATFSEEDARPYFALVAMRLMTVTCLYGKTAWTPAIVGQYGGIEAAVGNLAGAHRFLALFQAMLDQSPSRQAECRAQLIVHGMLSQWFEPYAVGRVGSRRGYVVGMESGDFIYALYSANHYSSFTLLSSTGLTELDSDMCLFCQQIKDFNQETLLTITMPIWQFVQSMIGGDGGEEQGKLSGEVFVLEEFAESVLSGTYMLAKVSLNFQRLKLANAFDRWFLMEELYDPFVRDREEVLRGHFSNQEATILEGLVSYKLYRHFGRRKYRKQARIATKRVDGWCKAGVVNCRCGASWLAAERVVLRDSSALKQKTQALVLYDQAIREAHELGVLQYEAAINERAFQVLMHTYGDERTAVEYLRCAIARYTQWEAYAKVDSLKQQHGSLLECWFPDNDDNNNNNNIEDIEDIP